MAKFQLDITNEHCPMTFVKTKIQLSRMQTGDVLELLLTDGEPLNNIPKSVNEAGHQVISTHKVADHKYLITIQK